MMAKRPAPAQTGGGVSRRTALIGAGALAGCAPLPAPEPPRPPRYTPDAIFRHGVASGDPLQDRVVLWTRASPRTPEPASEPLELRWVLARDAALTDVVAEGAARAEPERDWTVKVDVDGLAPGEGYAYAFEALGERSPIGRTRTLPEGPTAAFDLAVVSCANHPAGWFNVYRDIADRADADLVLCLGDYLYEYGPGEYATQWGARRDRVPDPPHEIVTLADYRRRHAQYKSDPDLQDAHAFAPWIMIWDDHESADNARHDGARNHQPGEGDWAARRAAALRAYFEWTPTREPAPDRAREDFWRVFEIGDLATLIMLETRLSARSPQISWDDAPVPPTADPDDPATQAAVAAFLRDVVGAEDRVLLAPDQEAAVEAALARSVADGKPWRLLGNQTLMAPMLSPDYVAASPAWLRFAMRLRARDQYRLMRRSPMHLPLNLDQWDGYPAARERLYAAARRSGAQLLTLSGDSHTFMVSRLEAADGAPVGIEVATTAVSSPAPFADVPDIGVDFGALTEAANAHVLHHNVRDRGYVALTLAHDAARAELRRVDTVESRDFRAETYKAFAIAHDPEGALTIEETGADPAAAAAFRVARRERRA
jgi:phosphodiesterase/alkaline phosphatase D-like protein